MAQWTPIQKNLHQNTGWQPYPDYRFAQQDSLAPLLLAEISSALPFYTLAFVKQGEQFQFIALQSLQPGLNLYVNAKGRWRVPYTPSHYRGYPFRLLPKADSDEVVFCFDQESGLLTEDKANNTPLFTEAGELSEKAQSVINFLQQCEKNRSLTQQAVNALAEQQLITPWPIESQNADGEKTPVTGLYRIDDSKLQQLPAQALESLHKQQALALAYGQLYSQARLKGLGQLYQLHEKEQQQKSNQEVDLDQLFGESEQDLFKF